MEATQLSSSEGVEFRMRGRVTFWISLILNGLLLALLIYTARLAQHVPAAVDRFVRASSSDIVVKTNVVVRRQNFTWDEVESKDYRVYIANLRSIGCPEETIKDLIVADLNHLYAQRRATEVVTADMQWWRSDADPVLLQTGLDKQIALEQERKALLTELLGTGWERTTNPNLAAFGGFNLNGGAFANMSLESRRAVEAIHSQARQRLVEYLKKAQEEGRDSDPTETARLQSETRQELAKVFSADQMEEYQLRYSPLSASLRNELRGFDLSADEFRAVFRARDSFDQQIGALARATDAASVKRREDLTRQRDVAIEQAFPDEKYPLFKLNQDPMFQQVQTAVRGSGAPADSVLPMYEIQHATQQEIQRIRADSNLAPEAMEKALLEVELDQQKSLRKILGEEAYKKLQQQNRR